MSSPFRNDSCARSKYVFLLFIYFRFSFLAFETSRWTSICYAQHQRRYILKHAE